MKDSDNRAEAQARAQVESVCAMVAALECDYDRLKELREERDELDTPETQAGLATWDASDLGDELRAIEAAAGDCESREDA